jgi:REP element-mobilizing transposase RayT
MGIGHNKNQKQFSLFKTNWKHQFNYGGTLRNLRKGRGQRPLSCSEPLHLVFKLNKDRLKTRTLRSSHNFKLVNHIIQKYAQKFFIKIEQLSIQADHIHCLLRTSRRSNFHYFFRVVAGQIAQQFENLELLSPPIKSSIRKTHQNSHSRLLPLVAQKSLPTAITKTLLKMKKEEEDQSSVTDTPRTAHQLWKYRPFSRVVRGYKAYLVVRDYIQLNEKEVTGVIRYSKNRLKGLSLGDWELLWA